MKSLSLLLLIFVVTFVQANGVGVINASTGVYARMNASIVTVNVDDQVAIVSTKQTFKNILAVEQTIKYAFPLPEGASGLNLRWYINGVWSTAVFSSSPQDTTLPGGGGTVAQNLKNFLGTTPLYFGIPEKLKKDSLLIIELTYVQLLSYKNGNVDFVYPNDYRLIQTASVDSQIINFSVKSQRTIDSITSLNHSGSVIQNSGNSASIVWKKIEGYADANYQFRYTLRSTELGLFSLSTNLPDSLGYFAFIVEPNPNTSVDVLKKVFTLIIDRSGSMSGTKMIQAKNAASFIVNNLNEGDKFNLIDFDDIISSFRPKHVLFTTLSRDSALQYIAQVDARGMTSISGAFEMAIPQFAFTADSTTANIIIFLTDGQATAGLVNTQDILNKIQTLTTTLERKVAIFAFGIGGDVNSQLLSLISSQNNGMTEFLGNDELEKRITDFYLKIRNPVLVNTTMTLSSNKVREVFPNPLPNLYKGEQMLVTGIYSQTPPIDLTLKGTAFGKPVTYNYSLALSDTAIAKNQFLPKIWAKKKIENLLVKFYNLPTGSLQADSVKKQIVALSISYGVISPFTSFSIVNPGTSVEDGTTANQNNVPNTYRIDGNFPNPFNPTTTLRFTVSSDIQKIVRIRI
ncbi:MAG TPA: hypothetical protein DCQ28_09715, partial [Bacteroidetes bacterium]|nr:hypothetical protein [Bacteroidota bacterium]